jgi:hypothetical protein
MVVLFNRWDDNDDWFNRLSGFARFWPLVKFQALDGKKNNRCQWLRRWVSICIRLNGTFHDYQCESYSSMMDNGVSGAIVLWQNECKTIR